jgi:hypothetical protein
MFGTFDRDDLLGWKRNQNLENSQHYKLYSESRGVVLGESNPLVAVEHSITNLLLNADLFISYTSQAL